MGTAVYFSLARIVPRASSGGTVISQQVDRQVSILCKRHDGTLSGQPVQEPLLADVGAALARGTKELDDGEGLPPVALEILHRPGITPGDLVLVSQTDGDWRGMARSVEHRFSVDDSGAIQATTQLEIIKK